MISFDLYKLHHPSCLLTIAFCTTAAILHPHHRQPALPPAVIFKVLCRPLAVLGRCLEHHVQCQEVIPHEPSVCLATPTIEASSLLSSHPAPWSSSSLRQASLCFLSLLYFIVSCIILFLTMALKPKQKSL